MTELETPEWHIYDVRLKDATSSTLITRVKHKTCEAPDRVSPGPSILLRGGYVTGIYHDLYPKSRLRCRNCGENLPGNIFYYLWVNT